MKSKSTHSPQRHDPSSSRGWFMIFVFIFVVTTMIAIDVIHRGMLDIHQNQVEFRSWGNSQADLHIIQFIDYMNLECFRGEQLIRELIAQHPDGVFLQTRFFPSDESMTAALYAECLGQQNKFQVYSQKLYERIGQWSGIPGDSVFQSLATDVHADMSTLSQCVSDPKSMTSIMTDRAFGESLLVRATPTYILNSKTLVGVNQLQKALAQWNKTLLENE